MSDLIEHTDEWQRDLQAGTGLASFFMTMGLSGYVVAKTFGDEFPDVRLVTLALGAVKNLAEAADRLSEVESKNFQRLAGKLLYHSLDDRFSSRSAWRRRACASQRSEQWQG